MKLKFEKYENSIFSPKILIEFMTKLISSIVNDLFELIPHLKQKSNKIFFVKTNRSFKSVCDKKLV